MSKVLALLLLPSIAWAADRRVVTLKDAITNADNNLPALKQAEAQTAVAVAQADELLSPLLPQLNGTGTYQRATSNFATQPGAVPNAINATAASSVATYNYYNFGLRASQTLFDAPTFARWRSGLATLGSQKAILATARLDAAYNARLAFFNARANGALVGVAKETLDNQKRHLDQVRGFVEVGTHPEIDLAQSKADVANAQVSLITANNNYDSAKAALNQAMGIAADTEFDLGEGVAEQIDLEDDDIEQLVKVAERARPELRSYDEQLHAQELTIAANKWGYAPTLGVSTGITDAGAQIENLAWNWNVQVQATWNLFGGFITYKNIKEAQAQRAVLVAQRDTERLQIRLDLEKGRLAVRAAKATLTASADAVENTRVREQLAEGRYQAGVGNAIELSDAVLALANASAQRVQADFNVGAARAQLLRALGRR